ncbi:MAG: BlaI/MecI/CopY family transcriptional regulator [Solirubrobacterales bacterium]|nr:BlaI/MecI/CopY family transcriptional regulator [Solirubrobacterales bacterium]
MARTEKTPGLSDLERLVMEQVWDSQDDVTVRQIVDRVNAVSDKERAYTTLMTIMSRLESKGMLKKQKRPRSDLFSPAVGKQEYLEARAKVEVDALVGEYGEIARALFVREIEESDPQAVEKLRRLAGEPDS